jgi:hypothetical protein
MNESIQDSAEVFRGSPPLGEFTAREKRIWERGYNAATTAIVSNVQFTRHGYTILDATPQLIYGSAPAREVRDLGDGKEIFPVQAWDELTELNAGQTDETFWRLETPHELFALSLSQDRVLNRLNANGACSYDSSIKPGWYWTSEEKPSGGRMVVNFSNGTVGIAYGNTSRAYARAIRIHRTPGVV